MINPERQKWKFDKTFSIGDVVEIFLVVCAIAAIYARLVSVERDVERHGRIIDELLKDQNTIIRTQERIVTILEFQSNKQKP